ncbi:hypothetical protein CEXT_289591 [Caerostris extrusa]|uniref:Uncharacterized protein n=1 Tax=Caerostris extrusa TaxID=172846 RepID=A0AAV4N3I2_CAEEX|nr:hypothetical protein CEXT_289591 [Caerostris extrusa]
MQWKNSLRKCEGGGDEENRITSRKSSFFFLSRSLKQEEEKKKKKERERIQEMEMFNGKISFTSLLQHLRLTDPFHVVRNTTIPASSTAIRKSTRFGKQVNGERYFRSSFIFF